MEETHQKVWKSILTQAEVSSQHTKLLVAFLSKVENPFSPDNWLIGRRKIVNTHHFQISYKLSKSLWAPSWKSKSATPHQWLKTKLILLHGNALEVRWTDKIYSNSIFLSLLSASKTLKNYFLLGMDKNNNLISIERCWYLVYHYHYDIHLLI